MKVLIGCESSGVIREAFRARGHDAWSCDLLPADDNSPFHFKSDIINIAFDLSYKWDLFIVHPTCRFLSSSGLHWNKRVPGRAEKTEKALEFVKKVWSAPIKKVCLENPVGCISTRIPEMSKPQYIQPYNFGEDASKKTGLWLRNLPPLIPTDYIKPRWVNGKPRWSNQTDSGQNRLGPSEDRWKERSRTYQGIAEAMATQWG